MNWEILAAVALVCLIAGVLISNLVKGGAAKAKSGASSLLDDAKSAGTTVVHKVESGAHSIGDLLHHPAAAPVATAPVAPVTSSDPIAAAHAALDAAIAEAQKALDDAKAKKDTLTKTVTAAVAAAK